MLLFVCNNVHVVNPSIISTSLCFHDVIFTVYISVTQNVFVMLPYLTNYNTLTYNMVLETSLTCWAADLDFRWDLSRSYGASYGLML